MNYFAKYSNYYNLLHQNKDYRAEVEYVISLFREYSSIPVKSVLDIGCGTGVHDGFFNEAGLEIKGIDLSESMISIAKEHYGELKNISFEEGDSKFFKLSQKFDSVVSLFHVMSYNTKNEDLLSTFKNVYSHLKEGGIFVFDFWYGPGVLQDLPSAREKVMEDDKVHVLRKTHSLTHFHENIVDVNFNVRVTSKIGDSAYTIDELHKVRYLFYPELQHFLSEAGFKTTKLLKWMSKDEQPGNQDWYALVVAQK